MAAISPQAVRRDSVRPLTEETIEIRFSAPHELEVKLGQLKGLLAHKYPHITLAELVDKLADLGLTEWNPSKPTRPTKTSTPLLHSAAGASVKAAAAGASVQATAAGAIHASQRREVWQRDQGKCMNCGSRHALEVDHCLPRSCGGSGAVENLRLLCRKCNQRAAIKALGLKKMALYLEGRHD